MAELSWRQSRPHEPRLRKPTKDGKADEEGGSGPPTNESFLLFYIAFIPSFDFVLLYVEKRAKAKNAAGMVWGSFGWAPVAWVWWMDRLVAMRNSAVLGL